MLCICCCCQNRAWNPTYSAPSVQSVGPRKKRVLTHHVSPLSLICGVPWCHCRSSVPPSFPTSPATLIPYITSFHYHHRISLSKSRWHSRSSCVCFSNTATTSSYRNRIHASTHASMTRAPAMLASKLSVAMKAVPRHIHLSIPRASWMTLDRTVLLLRAWRACDEGVREDHWEGHMVVFCTYAIHIHGYIQYNTCMVTYNTRTVWPSVWPGMTYTQYRLYTVYTKGTHLCIAGICKLHIVDIINVPQRAHCLLCRICCVVVACWGICQCCELFHLRGGVLWWCVL